jgi:AraC family transcriptional regulator, arabinose operon regulatory protein
MPRPGITFITGQYVPRCRHDIDKYFADYQTIQYMDSGAVSLRVGEKSYALNGRWFWSAYPGPRIAFRAGEPDGWWVHRYVAFRGPLVRRWEEDGLFPIVPQPVGEGRSWAARMDTLIALASEADPWQVVRAGHAMESLLIDLAAARAERSAGAGSAWMKSATDRMGEANASIDYEVLARELGMSARSLRRNFRRSLGVSPHQFVINQRIHAARQRLLSTDVPIKEIARELGYADVFYFGRQFKQQTGVSPAAFRR